MKGAFMSIPRLSLATVALAGGLMIPRAGAADAPAEKVTHSFLACGTETYILDGSGKVTWRYPHSSRDGWVLPDGSVLLALSKGKDHPGGAAVEVTRDGKVVFTFEGTQSEVNT